MSEILNVPILLSESLLVHEKNKCVECKYDNAIEKCEKCGEFICREIKCCELFPHYDSSNFAICRTCTDVINKKFKLVINLNELKLLKEKIKNKN